MGYCAKKNRNEGDNVEPSKDIALVLYLAKRANTLLTIYLIYWDYLREVCLWNLMWAQRAIALKNDCRIGLLLEAISEDC